MTYFELFDLSPAFDIDLQQLKVKYRQLQQQHHPDRQASNTTTSPDLISASKINQAYQTLLGADSRAVYLLQLHGQANGLENSIGDLDFLQHALELREQLEEADSTERLDTLRLEVRQWLESLGREFKFDLSEQDWGEARDTTRKLRFMQRILLDIDKAEDRFDEAGFADLDSNFDDDF